MNEQEKVFWDTIKILHENNVLNNLILIGSWAEYLYEKCYLGGFKCYLRTMDMDFLLKNLKPRVPGGKINLPNIFEGHGFICSEDPLNRITKFYKPGIIEIEFLVRELGSGRSEAYKIEPLGINVEGLRHLDILWTYSMWIKYNDYDICVPTPQGYLLHKLVINEKRGPKSEKDLRSVKNLLEYMSNSSDELERLRHTYESLTKGERKKIDSVCKKNAITLFPGYSPS